jgi:hypothetical protein
VPTPRELIVQMKAVQAELERRRAQTDPSFFCPQKPTPKQAEFLGITAAEALYGGGAGGGKSSTLLMAALEFVHVAGYAALILRRTYADLALPGAIMARALEWLLPKGVDWSDKDKTFTFPSGATLTFGYLDADRDRYRYAGSEFQFLGFDELTQFPEGWYRFLLSRLRKGKALDVPLRVRCASNPGDLGHEWVYRRFVDEKTREDRVFVPALLSDNPHIDAEEYEKALRLLDPVTRMQLLEGKWVRDAGGLVYAWFSEARNLVERAPPCKYYVLGIDFGFVDSTAFAVLGWNDNDPCVYVLESYKHARMTPSEAAEEVRRLTKQYDFVKIVGDTGGLGKGYAEEARRRFAIPIEAAQKTNKRGYIDLLNGALAGVTGGVPTLRLVEGANRDLVAEWLVLPWTKDRKKPAEGFEDHVADAVLYGWRACKAYAEEELDAGPPAGTPEYYARLEEKEYGAYMEKLEAEKRERDEETGFDGVVDAFAEGFDAGLH